MVLSFLFWVLVSGCNPFAQDDEWIYANTPVPPTDQREGKPLIITIGDSLAAGWGACSPDPCKGVELDWWQTALGDQAVVLSRGIGNTTTADLLDHWDRDTKDADVIFILIGVNDVARGSDADPILAHFETMHERALQAGIVPIFSTIMPADSSDLPAERAVVEAVNTQLLQKSDWFIIDLAAAMEDPAHAGYLPRDEIAFEGSAHPNEKGYAHMAQVVRAWWLEHQSAVLGSR